MAANNAGSQVRLLGVDSGGTFTDFVYYDGGHIAVHKTLSTPDQPERAILAGVEALGVTLAGTRIVHGTTVATNAVLEHQGARTAFITNHGLGDLLTIGRQARPELYNLTPQPVPPPVPPDRCLETGGRFAADGQVVEPLTQTEVDQLIARVRALNVDAVAVNLLFSFVDDRFEQVLGEALAQAFGPNLFVALSSQVLPEYREYERGITTWLNAYVGPLMHDYLLRLAARLSPASVAVMQSSGVTCGAQQAARQAVRLLLSGPAGGLQGARYVAASSGCERLITLDMGGTSTDVALIDGGLGLSSHGRIGRYPVAVPMVDMHTIGAGGGSLARVDAGGLLQVGPASAGAEPGPACYGRGGLEPTVTDANLVLGRIPRTAKLAGDLALDFTAAERAVGTLAGRLALSVAETALGIVRVANEQMVQAVRVISVQRGVDPREFVLVPFGGAGALHVCELAEALGITQALVPIHAGVLSALGMLTAPPGRRLGRTLGGLLVDYGDAEIGAMAAQMSERGRAELIEEGVEDATITTRTSLDLCYRGQSFYLNVPWRDVGVAAEQFQAAHLVRYGHALQHQIELVNVRVSVDASAPDLALPNHQGSITAQQAHTTELHGVGSVPVLQRLGLGVQQQIIGPAVILDSVATTYLAPGWRGQIDSHGNLQLDLI